MVLFLLLTKLNKKPRYQLLLQPATEAAPEATGPREKDDEKRQRRDGAEADGHGPLRERRQRGVAEPGDGDGGDRAAGALRAVRGRRPRRRRGAAAFRRLSRVGQ